MKTMIKRLWRRLRGRCVLCGDKKIPKSPVDAWSQGEYCRKCNKAKAFGIGYGMSRKRFETEFQK